MENSETERIIINLEWWTRFNFSVQVQFGRNGGDCCNNLSLMLFHPKSNLCGMNWFGKFHSWPKLKVFKSPFLLINIWAIMGHGQGSVSGLKFPWTLSAVAYILFPFALIFEWLSSNIGLLERKMRWYRCLNLLKIMSSECQQLGGKALLQM